MSAPRSPLPHLDEIHRLIDAALVTGERELLVDARDRLADVIGITKLRHPTSISGVPHLHWPPRGFRWIETASSYAGWNDRWIVSLIAGYDADAVSTAVGACAAARDLVVGPGRDGTRWFVHDRAAGSTVVIPQGTARQAPRPTAS